MTRVPIPKRKPRPPATQVGPVTAAIAAMRAADLDAADLTRIRALRRAIAARIEADIAVLDMLGGDPDCEPSLGSLDAVDAQLHWSAGTRCDREQENEHGGDIVDEPHDAEEDIGAEEDDGFNGAVTFDGINYHQPRSMLGRGQVRL